MANDLLTAVWWAPDSQRKLQTVHAAGAYGFTVCGQTVFGRKGVRRGTRPITCGSCLRQEWVATANAALLARQARRMQLARVQAVQPADDEPGTSNGGPPPWAGPGPWEPWPDGDAPHPIDSPRLAAIHPCSAWYIPARYGYQPGMKLPAPEPEPERKPQPMWQGPGRRSGAPRNAGGA